MQPEEGKQMILNVININVYIRHASITNKLGKHKTAIYKEKEKQDDGVRSTTNKIHL